jgi:hypothetical protein
MVVQNFLARVGGILAAVIRRKMYEKGRENGRRCGRKNEKFKLKGYNKSYLGKNKGNERG